MQFLLFLLLPGNLIISKLKTVFQKVEPPGNFLEEEVVDAMYLFPFYGTQLAAQKVGWW